MRKRLLALLLVAVLVPIGYGVAVSTSSSVGAQPAPPRCGPAEQELGATDTLGMNLVRVGRLVKLIKVEKELYLCDLDGDDAAERVFDIQIFPEIVEKIRREPRDPKNPFSQFPTLTTRVVVVRCEKAFDNPARVECEQQERPDRDVPRLEGCAPALGPIVDLGNHANPPSPGSPDPTASGHPIEMETVTVGNVTKTVKTQKEIFQCPSPYDEDQDPSAGNDLVVDVETFTEIFEVNTKPVARKVETLVCLKDFPQGGDEDRIRPTVIACEFRQPQRIFPQIAQ